MKGEKVFYCALLLFIGACTGVKPEKSLTIFHAGSLALPLKAATDSFIKENKGVQIYLESAGSVECSRKITELGRKCDLFFSADYKVIKNLFSSKHASFLIPFAGNNLILAYRPDSKFANRISERNWMDVLLNEEVKFGRSEPDNDPCGYRTVLLLKLAEKYYNRPNIASQLLSKDTEYIRPKEVDLIGLLEAHAIDYMFIYESVARQHKMEVLNLPDSINLSNPDCASYYATVSTKIKGSKPREYVLIKGQPILYAFTIPNNAPNRELAKKFALFFLSREGGLKIMDSMGQRVLVPFNASGCGEIPSEFISFAKTE